MAWSPNNNFGGWPIEKWWGEGGVGNFQLEGISFHLMLTYFLATWPFMNFFLYFPPPPPSFFKWSAPCNLPTYSGSTSLPLVTSSIYIYNYVFAPFSSLSDQLGIQTGTHGQCAPLKNQKESRISLCNLFWEMTICRGICFISDIILCSNPK